MGKRKGFTLTELIIVLAIIGILTAILVPSWGYYLQRSRIRSQNYKAKVIFNAAQTVITDLEFSERHYKSYYDNGADPDKAFDYIYTPNGIDIPGDSKDDNKWYFYYNGVEGHQCKGEFDYAKVYGDDDSISDVKKSTIDSWDHKIQSAIAKMVSDEQLVYKIYVDGYTVVSVASARSENDQYLGSHPKTFDKRIANDEDTSSEVRAKRALHVDGVNMDDFAL